MQNEAGIETEARTWVPIIQLKEASGVVGIVTVGDRNQLEPVQLSKGARINEFGLHSSHSLYDRLLYHRFPSTQLLVQYRIHPHICGLVNERIYKNRLVNDESTQNRARNDNWDKFLKLWIPVSQSLDPMYPSLLFLNVTDGIDVCGQLSRSQSNTANVNVVASLLSLVQVSQVLQESKAQGCHIGTVQGPKDSLSGTYATTGTGVGLSRRRPCGNFDY